MNIMDKKDFAFRPIPFGATTKEEILAYINQNAIPFEIDPGFALDDSQRELIDQIKKNALDLATNTTITRMDGSIIVGVDSTASPDTEKTVSRNLRGCMSSVQTLDDSAFQHGIDMTPPSDNQSDIP